MTDLHTRFRTLDDLPAPDLWPEVEAKASATQRESVRTFSWVLIAATLLLALAVGGAVLIGSGIVKMPVVEIPAPAETSAAPSSTRDQNSAPTWTSTRKMVDARVASNTATLLPNGKVLVAGGYVYSGGDLVYLSSAELYDPSSATWTATGNMIEAHSGHAATLLPDGKVLVSGGYRREPEDHYLSSAELYDPSSGSWTAAGNMVEGRFGHTATLLPDGKVLVAGGDGNSGGIAHFLSSAELYDPRNGTWTATGNMVEARYLHTATLLPDGKVLVAGGDNSHSPSAELYDPSSGSWTATGNMVEARNSHTATLLPDGKVLVAGVDDRASPSAELYDPGSGRWTATGNTVEPRVGHTATLLPDGKVLVAGGSVFRGGALDYLSSAELYDPSSGTWTATKAMIAARNAATATLLPDGRVLVVGGMPPPELYDPGGGS